jgi:hypothetical protein
VALIKSFCMLQRSKPLFSSSFKSGPNMIKPRALNVAASRESPFRQKGPALTNNRDYTLQPALVSNNAVPCACFKTRKNVLTSERRAGLFFDRIQL